MTIAYDGTRYHGWQYQPGLVTVESQLCAVLAPITQTDVDLRVAGRTDAGVHALGQTANFTTASRISLHKLRMAANARLDDEIVIRRIDEVRPEFHATRDALGKHYRYTIWADMEKPLFNQSPYVYHFYRPLDGELMRQAARLLIGTHDFKSFETTSKKMRESTVRTINRLDIRRHGPLIWIEVEGTGFLYNMVRNIAGTLVEIGRGHWPVSRIPEIIAARRRAAAGPTLPPEGLTLMRVFYNEDLARAAPAPPATGP